MSGQRSRARRRPDLSQHFLKGRTLASSLVEQAAISRNDLVVEIGPGRGALTRVLAKRCRRLVAVELDGRLLAGLRPVFQADPHVELVHGDFLSYDLPAGRYKAFGNIPYSRTAAVVRRLVNSEVPPDDAYLILQREAAERFAGTPLAAETLVSLLLKPWWQIEIVRRLRRADFDPPPAVDSVLLWLAKRTRPLVSHAEGRAYREFVSTSFGRRGNTVKRCLTEVFTGLQIARLAVDLRFRQGDPPSSLSFEQWLGLFRFLRLIQTESMRTAGTR